MRQDMTIMVDGKKKNVTIKLRGETIKPKQIILNKKDKANKRNAKQWQKEVREYL